MIETESKPDRWRCQFSNGRVEGIADTTTRGGAGTGIRPHELLEAALATCLNMTVRMAADERGVDPDSVETSVALDRNDQGATFVYSIDVDGPMAEQLRAAASTCPVERTLSGDIDFVRDPERFE